MTHPLTPPDELVEQWRHSWLPSHGEFVDYMTTRAAQWGADQELEACVELTRDNDGYDAALGLRAARRPKPPSLKEQALKAIGVPTKFGEARVIEHREHELVRRALEALPND